MTRDDNRAAYARFKAVWDWFNVYALALVAGSVVGMVQQFVGAAPRNDGYHAALVWGLMLGLAMKAGLYFTARSEPD